MQARTRTRGIWVGVAAATAAVSLCAPAAGALPGGHPIAARPAIERPAAQSSPTSTFTVPSGSFSNCSTCARVPTSNTASDAGSSSAGFFCATSRMRLSSRITSSSALIDFGHDLKALGQPPDRPAWHIGLEDPVRPETTNGSIAVIGKGVASSGDYIRRVVIGGRKYGHIVDPRGGRPVANGCLQATVVTGSCLQAGVLSTTAFVLGVTKGIEFIQSFPGAEGLIITENARAQTRGFFNYVVS